MSIDWSAPIEAVDANGAVTPAKWHWRDEAGDELGVRFVTCDWFGWPFRDGGQPVHKMDRVWALRNVTPPMTDLSPETVGTTPPDDPRADDGLEAAVIALYERHPTIFYDKVDGACEMAWQEAKTLVTIEWLEAIGNARAALAAARSHGGM